MALEIQERRMLIARRVEERRGLDEGLVPNNIFPRVQRLSRRKKIALARFGESIPV